MPLAPGGQRTGRGEPHAGDDGTQAVQGRRPVVVPHDLDRLDDQAHPLLVSEVELADRLRHAFREDRFRDLYHAIYRLSEGSHRTSRIRIGIALDANLNTARRAARSGSCSSPLIAR